MPRETKTSDILTRFNLTSRRCFADTPHGVYPRLNSFRKASVVYAGSNKISRAHRPTSRNRFARGAFFPTTKSSGSYCTVCASSSEKVTIYATFRCVRQLLARNTLCRAKYFSISLVRYKLFVQDRVLTFLSSLSLSLSLSIMI